MDLTIFLVTKGREEYLDQILESFSRVNSKDIKFLILDNGTNSRIRSRIEAWRNRHSEFATVVRFKENEARQSAYWEIMKSHNVEWVVCPSDDDEFRFEIVEEWKQSLRNKPNMIGFAASAAIMNKDGLLTGEFISPSIRGLGSHVDRVASAFHEPPFHWPSLFFHLPSLPSKTPPSRYAFDWWLGIQLLLAGEVVISDSLAVNYRVHGQQESFLAPHRRKYFEAQIWLNEIAAGREFSVWLNRLSNTEKFHFWTGILRILPIYGDKDFSRPILGTIFRSLQNACDDINSNVAFANEYAIAQGVFLKNKEALHLISKFPPNNLDFSGNIRLIARPDTCKMVTEACTEAQSIDASLTIEISCFHSKPTSSATMIDCGELVPHTPNLNTDLILRQATELLENQGSMNFVISNGEKKLIQVFRVWRVKLPKSIRHWMRILKRFY